MESFLRLLPLRRRLRSGSVMMVNGEVYGRLTVDDVPGILAKYE